MPFAFHRLAIPDVVAIDPKVFGDVRGFLMETYKQSDFAAFVGCAHSLGLKVYLDVVVNHTGDIVQVAGTSFVSPAQKAYRDGQGLATALRKHLPSP